MCGIIGIASNKPVSMNIVNSLKKLEYRGYDSAGLATIVKDEISEKKCSGRVEELEKNSIVGAGSVITKNVKKNSLAITRSSQIEVKNYKRKRKK